MFCPNCGREVDPRAFVCVNCGARVQQGAAPSAGDGPIGGLGILCFLFPVVGLVLYLVWKDNMPIKAKGAGKAALWGFLVSIAIGILWGIIVASTAASYVNEINDIW